MMNRLVGLHIRYEQSPFAIFEKAQGHNISIAQFFLHNQTGNVIHLTPQEYTNFRRQAEKQLKLLIAHGSYLINLASPDRSFHPVFIRELNCAQQLGCTHYVLHAGSAPSIEQGIDAIARHLNNLGKKELALQIVLENVAFALPSIGNDFQHFRSLLEKIDKPERIMFCIDTSHAYAAGYDLINEQQKFIDLVETTIGTTRVALLHINDTAETCGSNRDQHLMLGTGVLGTKFLKKFVLHEKLSSRPIILELPPLSEEQEKKALKEVISWHTRE